MPEPGDLVGPYRLVSLLGKGAMGEVWRAHDDRLNRFVAVKVLPTELAEDVERRARMLREARAAAAIRHPNVVTLFDIVSNDGQDILVMELVEGRTLSDALRKDGAPPLETALRWIEGVADALVAAHARGILHRDIKAANIMVTADGGVKVLDFGLAKLRDGSDLTTSVLRPPPTASNTKLALDATMASEPGSSNTALDATRPSHADLDSYKTHAGSLLGTPLYMAPEQIAGALPDERSEIFSVGVLAHEILAGKPPYTATTMDALFLQITKDDPPELIDIPDAIANIVHRALAKEPADRWPTMAAFRDAIAHERKQRFSPRARRWPLVAAAVVALAGAGIGAYAWRTSQASRPRPLEPGDAQVQRALEEYDVFYNDKALSSLRSALAIAPDHARANAYVILFGGASDTERTNAVAALKRATPSSPKDRALRDAAIALVERGPAAARTVLTSATTTSRELAFWAAELDFRAGNYAAARDGYKQLLEDPTKLLRGRIYDHYSAVLLYFDEPQEALRIGELYRAAFPGEADAVGVYATTLSAAGKHAEAIAAAEEALRLAEGEDTFAGLGKVLAHAGNRARAKEMYQRSLERAGASRRPLRRAALAMLQWIDGDPATAKATVAPCLPGGSDSTARERGACLFMAGVIDPSQAELAATELDKLAAEGTALRPPYGAPASLAQLVRARVKFFGGACVLDVPPSMAATDDAAAYETALDFYAAYHVPFVATWSACEKATAMSAAGDSQGSYSVLDAVIRRAPGRSWLTTARSRLDGQ